MIPPVKAVLFDVLHTLVDDSGFPRYQLRNLLIAEEIDLDDGQFEEVYQALSRKEYDWDAAAVETPFRSIRDRHRSRLTALYEHFGLNEHRDLESDIELLWKRIATSGLYGEVSEVLPTLAARGYRLALISNADENDPVIQVILGAELPVTFEVVVTSEGAGAYKPAARIFEHALWRLDLDPQETVFVGDSPSSDIAGGSRAGLRTVWVNRKGGEYPAGYPAPDATVTDLTGLFDLLPGVGDTD
ncbi:HAD family hydrolase [Gemmatimonadota bacterium]